MYSFLMYCHIGVTTIAKILPELEYSSSQSDINRYLKEPLGEYTNTFISCLFNEVAASQMSFF